MSSAPDLHDGFDAFGFGHDQIHHDQIERRLLQGLEAQIPVVGAETIMAFSTKRIAEQVANLGVVVYQ
jgi:hypothetical protein